MDEGQVRPSYFQSFERELERERGGMPPSSYDEDRMERKFRPLQYVTVHSRYALDLDHLRTTFSILPEYEIEHPG